MAEKFHTELEHLRTETLEMAHLGRFMLATAVDALVRQDKELAVSVVARKEEIRAMEIHLEERCYQLISLHQPMAKDMRVIACTLKVITASLRIGRYGKVIANIVKKISDQSHIANLMSIPHMADLVIEMIDDSIEAYERGTIPGISDFSKRDDTIDALRQSIFREAITYMMEDPKSITRCTYYILVARYLERSADHACIIAENIHYLETGERIEVK